MAYETKKWLESVGVADTRAINIAVALQQIHASAAMLDGHNQAVIWKVLPEMMKLADAYAKLEGGLATFSPREQVNETITLKGHISTDETDEKALTG